MCRIRLGRCGISVPDDIATQHASVFHWCESNEKRGRTFFCWSQTLIRIRKDYGLTDATHPVTMKNLGDVQIFDDGVLHVQVSVSGIPLTLIPPCTDRAIAAFHVDGSEAMRMTTYREHEGKNARLT